MLATAIRRSAPISYGARSASLSRCAMISAAFLVATSSRRTTNSSPPTRAAVSPAGGMAQGVVDRLEVVEIEEQDRESGLAPVCKAQAVGQTVPEEGAVRQAGQLVVERSVAKFCRGDGELGRSVSDPALDLAERRFELLAEEVHAGRGGIDDVG